MSLRLEMLQAARRAPKLLGHSTALVREFLLARQNPDGGFQGRDGQSDLYYTSFALGALTALEHPPLPGDTTLERAADYLGSFEDRARLDLVHLCCWIRSWANLSMMAPEFKPELKSAAELLGKFRTQQGGYSPVPGTKSGTTYGAFLALGALQDAAVSVPDPARLAESVNGLRTPAGGFLNEPLPKPTSPGGAAAMLFQGTTNATAAAVLVLRELAVPVDTSVSDWLLARSHPGGGFVATPATPMPDLLSTATVLHALTRLGMSIEPLKEGCLDFVDTLWTNQGGFHGHWADDVLDCEYTFYGLLALGHLAG